MRMPIGAPRKAARLGAALAALALAAAPRAGAAQEGGLTLDGVVRRALEQSRDIQVARARAEGTRGQALAAGGIFDLQMGASVTSATQSAYEPGQAGLVAATSRTTAYSLQASRLLRSGITLDPRLTVSRTALQGVAVADAGSTVSLDMGVPLLRDRLGRASRAPEAALRLRAGAGGRELAHATALSANAAAAAYWEYAAAHARLRVYAEAEERAARRVEETRTLVRGDERPAADLPTVEASLSRARQQRIAAEQAVEEARAGLGLGMGMELAESAGLPAPATPFPAAAPWTPDAAEEARLVRLGLERRGDLEAGAIGLRSSDLYVEAAREALKPRLDLHLSVGYTGRQIGPGYGGLVEPLYRDVPGLNAGVRMEYQLPGARTEARGVAAQNEAARAERAADLMDLRRRVAAGVSVTLHALRRNAAVVAEAERAVALYRATVENEQAKSRLGASTLFDVTYAEDNLTSAMLGLVGGRLAYAKALAQLRFETGTLAHEADGRPTVDPAALVTRP
jgi:outer membrane protein TolC